MLTKSFALPATLALCLFATGCNIFQTRPRGPRVTISRLDFAPAQGDFHAKCTGNALRFADVKHYRPIIELQSPAATGFTLGFSVKEEVWWIDPELAFFVARFNAGSRTPDEIKTPNFTGLVETPSGAPDATIGTFWLGCTKLCRIKGNSGRGADGVAAIYLERFGIWFPDDPTASLGGIRDGSRHTVRCRK